jgi:hypothetical protein
MEMIFNGKLWGSRQRQEFMDIIERVNIGKLWVRVFLNESITAIYAQAVNLKFYENGSVGIFSWRGPWNVPFWTPHDWADFLGYDLIKAGDEYAYSWRVCLVRRLFKDLPAELEREVVSAMDYNSGGNLLEYLEIVQAMRRMRLLTLDKEELKSLLKLGEDEEQVKRKFIIKKKQREQKCQKKHSGSQFFYTGRLL